jgi:dihydrofolate synthase/folylpolyglutamate synthase
MDYASSLAYLYSLQLFGVKLGLENTRQLLERVGNPQQSLKVVHIAGTNGKGSTAAALEQLLRAHDLRTGLYTSPHLYRFNERIRIDNQPVTDDDIHRFVEVLRAVVRELPVTFFEFTTVLALLLFAEYQVDTLVLETGLGGRFDATNLVDPVLSVITPIDVDHSAQLGTTLAQIAFEKGGIVKPSVPLICAFQPPEVQEVLAGICQSMASPLWQAGVDFSWTMPPHKFSYRGFELQFTELETGLAGAFQRQNLSLALAAAEKILPRETLDPRRVRRALAEVRWPGRLEWCGDILFDGAHNPHGAQALAEYLQSCDLNELLWVVAVKADKDVAALMAPVLPRVSLVLATSLPDEKSYQPAMLVQLAQQAGVAAEVCKSPAAALQRALGLARPGQKILVAGSLFLVAALRPPGAQ